MNSQELLLAAKVAVSRNRNDHVVAATVKWDREISELTLTYYLDRQPNESDEESSNYALDDLTAEFCEIVTASARCMSLEAGSMDDLEEVVYRRE